MSTHPHREPESSLVGLLLAERYRILRELGRGGMGVVYVARDERLGHEVAVKCVHPRYAGDETIVARFHREARAVAALANPHVVEVLDLGVWPEGGAFLVMEKLHGRDLAAEIEQRGPLTVARAARIALQICSALSEAHAQDIVHRDLKPENVFLLEGQLEEDFIKILDFGIVKIAEGHIGFVGQPDLTKTGAALGTPYFMSPEQILGEESVDHRTDIYALGVLLYCALTGEYPFTAVTVPALALKIVSDPPPSMRRSRPEIPEALEAAVMKMLAKEPAERFASCAEVREALEGFARAPGRLSERPPERSRWALLIGAGLASLAGLLLAAAWLWASLWASR